MALYQSVDYFGITFLLAVLAAYFICENGVANKIIGMVLLVFSLGAYQAYVGAALIILILDCLLKTLNGEKFKEVLVRGWRYVVSVIGSIGFYYLILKILLWFSEAELSSYKGIDNMSQNLRPDVLLNSIRVAFISLKGFLINNSLGIYSGKVSFFNIVLISLFVILEVKLAKKCNVHLKSMNTIMGVFLNVICLPLGANIIGVLSANTSFYYITVAPFVLLFVLPIVLLEKLDDKRDSKNKVIKVIAFMVVCVTISISFKWTIQNNTVYQKLLLINQEYDMKLSSLVTRIQENEKYKEGVDVVVGNAPYDFV